MSKKSAMKMTPFSLLSLLAAMLAFGAAVQGAGCPGAR